MRQERHKATSIGQHLSRNASTRVSILKFTEKNIFSWMAEIKVFEKINFAHALGQQWSCAQNNLNLNFSRKKIIENEKLFASPESYVSAGCY